MTTDISKKRLALCALMIYCFVAPVSLFGRVGVASPVPPTASDDPMLHPTPEEIHAKSEKIMAGYAWTTHKWTGDDTPYRKIRQMIDGALASGWSPINLAAQYKAIARKNRQDPRLQYQWAYAAYLSSRIPSIDRVTAQETAGWAGQALSDAPQPHAYEYDRLRCLINWNISDGMMVGMGRRLLKRTPNDYMIQWCLAKDLSDPTENIDNTVQPPIVYRSAEQVRAQQMEAIALAKKMLKEYPDDVRPYEIIANTYRDLWNHDNSQEYGDKAIEAYRKLVDDRGTTPDRRQTYNRMIYIIQGGLVPYHGGYLPKVLPIPNN